MIKCNTILLIEEFINDSKYSILENGKIFYYSKILKCWKKTGYADKKGYCSIGYKWKKLFIHRIIYRKYLGLLDDSLTINHKDGDPYNNHIDNLELVTQKENNLHRFRVLGHKPVIGYSKINEEIAEKIREDRLMGMKYSDLMKKYKLCKSTVSYVVNKRTWK